MCDITITDCIIAVAVLTQAILTIILVLVYIKRQTRIMQEQNCISSEQFKWNMNMLFSAQYPIHEAAIQQERAGLHAESERFYNEQHSEPQTRQFEANHRTKELALIQLELGLIGLRKHLESEGAYYGQSMIEQHENDTNFYNEVLREILSLGYSEDLFRLAWEQFLSGLFKNDDAP